MGNDPKPKVEAGNTYTIEAQPQPSIRALPDAGFGPVSHDSGATVQNVVEGVFGPDKKYGSPDLSKMPHDVVQPLAEVVATDGVILGAGGFVATSTFRQMLQLSGLLKSDAADAA